MKRKKILILVVFLVIVMGVVLAGVIIGSQKLREITKERLSESASVNVPPEEESPQPQKEELSQPEENYVLNKKYLMSFHACDSSVKGCRDPRDHEVYLAQSDDGKSWSVLPGWQPYEGSVPDVIRRNGTVYIFTPGAVRKYDLKTNTLSKRIEVELDDSKTTAKFVDPSVIEDEQGRLVLFYMPGIMGQDPARCASGESQCTKVFRSAVEKEGSDGTKFTASEGNRVEITIKQDVAADPDIFFNGQQYVLYISRGQGVQVFTSNELHGNYTEVSPDNFLLREGGVPAGYFAAENSEYWTYIHSGQPQAVIKQAVHKDLTTFLESGDFTEVIGPTTMADQFSQSFTVESPGFALNQP